MRKEAKQCCDVTTYCNFHVIENRIFCTFPFLSLQYYQRKLHLYILITALALAGTQMDYSQKLDIHGSGAEKCNSKFAPLQDLLQSLMPQIHYDILIIFIKTFHNHHHQFKENEGTHLTYFFWPHTRAKIHNLSKKSQNSLFENLIIHKIHIFKVSFFTKFTFFNHQILGNFCIKSWFLTQCAVVGNSLQKSLISY